MKRPSSAGTKELALLYTWYTFAYNGASPIKYQLNKRNWEQLLYCREGIFSAFFAPSIIAKRNCWVEVPWPRRLPRLLPFPDCSRSNGERVNCLSLSHSDIGLEHQQLPPPLTLRSIVSKRTKESFSREWEKKIRGKKNSFHVREKFSRSSFLTKVEEEALEKLESPEESFCFLPSEWEREREKRLKRRDFFQSLDDLENALPFFTVATQRPSFCAPDKILWEQIKRSLFAQKKDSFFSLLCIIVTYFPCDYFPFIPSHRVYTYIIKKLTKRESSPESSNRYGEKKLLHLPCQGERRH